MLHRRAEADPRRGKPRAAAFEGLRKLWGGRAVEEITHADVDALHRRVGRSAPYMANRLVALLSRMFGLAVRWGWRADNPAKGIERNQEMKRQRFLTPRRDRAAGRGAGGLPRPAGGGHRRGCWC